MEEIRQFEEEQAKEELAEPIRAINCPLLSDQSMVCSLEEK